MTWATTLMTQLSGAMASIVLLVMTVIFMLFEGSPPALQTAFCPQ